MSCKEIEKSMPSLACFFFDFLLSFVLQWVVGIMSKMFQWGRCGILWNGNVGMGIFSPPPGRYNSFSIKYTLRSVAERDTNSATNPARNNCVPRIMATSAM